MPASVFHSRSILLASLGRGTRGFLAWLVDALWFVSGGAGKVCGSALAIIADSAGNPRTMRAPRLTRAICASPSRRSSSVPDVRSLIHWRTTNSQINCKSLALERPSAGCVVPSNTATPFSMIPAKRW